MDLDTVDRLRQLIGTPGTRRAALGMLLGSALLGTGLDTVAKTRGNRKGPRRAKGAGRDGVQAQSKPDVIGPIHDEGTVELLECEGFTILDEYQLDFTLRWLTDKDGNQVKGVEQVSGTDTLINSETGKAIAAPFHNNVLIDPETGLGASAGIIFKVTVPGAGAVFLDVGRIVTNQAGDIITFEAGPHQFFDGDVDALCAALA